MVLVSLIARELGHLDADRGVFLGGAQRVAVPVGHGGEPGDVTRGGGLRRTGDRPSGFGEELPEPGGGDDEVDRRVR